MSECIYTPSAEQLAVFGYYPIDYDIPEDATSGCDGELNGFYGKTHTPEARQRISAGNKGRIKSAKERKAISEAKKGKVPTLANGKPISTVNKGKPRNKQQKKADLKNVEKAHEARSTFVEIDGIIYPSICEAARQLGFKSKTPVQTMIKNGTAKVIKPSKG